MLSIKTATTPHHKTSGTNGTTNMFAKMLAIFVVPVKNSKTGKVPTHAPIDGSMYDFRSVVILLFVGNLSAILLITSIPASAEKLRRNHRS